jgi:hypothetical protein
VATEPILLGVLATLALLATLAAWRSAVAAHAAAAELRWLWVTTQRPHVLLFVDVDAHDALVLTTLNAGTHPATEVRIHFLDPLFNASLEEISARPLFRTPIPVVPPGRALRQVIDASREDFFAGRPQARWRYTLEYTDPVTGYIYGSGPRVLSARHLAPPPATGEHARSPSSGSR